MEENLYNLVEWKEIAKLTHYSPQWVAKKFGPELKRLGILVVKWISYRDVNGKVRRRRAAIAPKWQLERYFMEKKRLGEY